MRLIARFAQEQKNHFEIITVYDTEIIKELIEKENPEYISIAQEYPAALWFEQKIYDDFGIQVVDVATSNLLVKDDHFPQEFFPLRKEFSKLLVEHNDTQVKRKKKKKSKQINLGPTHSYSLESSLFKLKDNGRKILDFSLIPSYKYRGIEKMVEGFTFQEAQPIIERISAPQTIAYQTAWLDIQLQASKKVLPDIIKKRHLFLLELERINNHLHDLSILTKLVEFQEGASFFLKFLESGRMAMKNLTGHRYGFNAVTLNANDIELSEGYTFLLNLEKELHIFEKWMAKREEILDKMHNLGKLSTEQIEAYGLVGTMARSANVPLDRRKKDAFYEKHNFYLNLEEQSDVFSRFNLRISEIFTSLRIMRNLGKGTSFQFFLGKIRDGEYYSFVESSAGEVMMYLSLKEGVIHRFYLRDPSFLNAQILPLLLKDSKIENLGLTLKSIPLNISAIDL